MRVTNVEVTLNQQGKVRAFCVITFDDEFVVEDVRVIDCDDGVLVAMPSRQLTGHCSECRAKVSIRDRFCCQCGNSLKLERVPQKIYTDVAHPISRECRRKIEEAVLAALRVKQGAAAEQVGSAHV